MVGHCLSIGQESCYHVLFPTASHCSVKQSSVLSVPFDREGNGDFEGFQSTVREGMNLVADQSLLGSRAWTLQHHVKGLLGYQLVYLVSKQTNKTQPAR